MGMNNNDKIVEIKDLYVQYRTDDSLIYALNGLNLELKRGETLGLVGETGAGKTTTARSIIQLLPDRIGKISHGEILFNGMHMEHAKESQLQSIRGVKISMIFQDPMTSLNPVITVGKQLAEVFEVHNTDNLSEEEIDKKVDEMMKLVGLSPDRKNEYPHQFSGGMKQRACIAMALACEPELLLADEPTTALDVTIQAQVLELMKRLKREYGTSMLLITHDLGVVAQMCDRVAIMYAGEIIEMGTAEAIYDAAIDHHPYTVGLFGSIPSLNTSSTRLSPIPGLMPDPTIQMKGCPFADRCQFKTQKCVEEKPAPIEKNGLMIKCHRFQEEGEK